MPKLKMPTIAILALQVLALLIYPPAYFRQAPQAAVMPPALLIMLVLAIVGMNTGTLSLVGGRSLLIFVQGINMIVRLMSLFPNLKTPSGDWAIALLICQVVGLALSWYTMVALERRPLQSLRIRPT